MRVLGSNCTNLAKLQGSWSGQVFGQLHIDAPCGVRLLPSAPCSFTGFQATIGVTPQEQEKSACQCCAV